MMNLLRQFFNLLFDLTLERRPPTLMYELPAGPVYPFAIAKKLGLIKDVLPDVDGRRFAWVDAIQYAREGGQAPLVPVILFDPLTCGEATKRIAFERKLDPSEYGMSLDELASKYSLETVF